MIRCNVENSKLTETLSFAQLINNLRSHKPLQPLFNKIAWTLKPKAKMTSFGYDKSVSEFLADGTSSINSYWKSFMKKEKSLKAIVLSMMVLNWINGSKEVENVLHKYKHGILYADIRHLRKSWANEVTKTNKVLESILFFGKFIHQSNLFCRISIRNYQFSRKKYRHKMIKKTLHRT